MTVSAPLDFVTAFEEKLFFDIPIPADKKLGVAVSGGADSIALLTALSHRFGAASLAAITVNHNIRPAAESKGDADFTAAYCAQLGVPCTVVTLEPGKVHETAFARGRGEEEAARFLRYQAFDAFISEQNLCALCLAHNQNDQLETLVMRFLQGSSAAGGIAYRRGKIVRPLLQISRADIERYLCMQGLAWRTDATNADTSYFRNRVRNLLIPLLNAQVAGWQQAVLSGAEKASDDNSALSALADRFSWQPAADDALCMPVSEFFAQPMALRRRLIYKALTLLQCDERFPYAIVRTVCNWEPSLADNQIEANGMQLYTKKSFLFVKKIKKKATENGFIGILEQYGATVHLGDFAYTVNSSGYLLQGAVDSIMAPVCKVQLPVCIRSAQSADVVIDAAGKPRLLSGIFSSWHVEKSIRSLVPVVQELAAPEQPIIAVLGNVCNSKNWIVNERRLDGLI